MQTSTRTRAYLGWLMTALGGGMIGFAVCLLWMFNIIAEARGSISDAPLLAVLESTVVWFIFGGGMVIIPGLYFIYTTTASKARAKILDLL
jgi:hypothetical protein